MVLKCSDLHLHFWLTIMVSIDLRTVVSEALLPSCENQLIYTPDFLFIVVHMNDSKHS